MKRNLDPKIEWKTLNISMISHTKMKERLKELFFNETLKRWHFEDILKKAKMSRERTNHALKQLVKEKFIKRIKPKNKMPYYLVNRDSQKFRSEKRLYGLQLLQKTGLFDHLNSLPDIKTAILFGSFARGDWNKSSDIDLFLYGDAEYFEKGRFEYLLLKEIQLFNYNSPKKIKKELDPRLIPNIVKGFNIKGSLEPFKVNLNA